MMKANEEKRESVIVRTNIVGILTNLILVIFKAIVGLISNSIAILLDAVNNLSDALSSIITVIATKLANREPDKKHPLGHGRIEYLSAMIVAGIIFYAGITSLIESIKKIINPVKAEYSNITLIILVISIIIKLLLGKYVKNIGEKFNSPSLVASGSDATFDAILSFSVLASAIIYLLTNISLEAYVGVLISIFIIKSGIEIFMEAVDEILGKRVDRKTIAEIKKTICSIENVYGAYDLVLNNYGPDKYIGSVHIEILDSMTAEEIDPLERHIVNTVLEKHNIYLAGITIYSMNTKNEEIIKIHSNILKTVMSNKEIVEFHAFYVDMKEKTIRFDIIIDYSVKNREEIYDKILNDVKKEYPEYIFNIKVDIDI
ncbi:cation diffusion facilitator family transporter [Fusobacterium simiae]|uniref:Cation diffusion facilitator family transporter n=1 Tax=Fusobacterium simiae TaxID=855 RepID=A0ABT4DEK4_FUSSI|nr:cation diffusion facilitator family transporter [Fusobacterium simiae]MCY7007034.1 cation diffusion facilitator family transporter [Fusobacterium simiae]